METINPHSCFPNRRVGSREAEPFAVTHRLADTGQNLGCEAALTPLSVVRCIFIHSTTSQFLPSSCVSQEDPGRRSLEALKVPDSGSALQETEPPQGQEKRSEGSGQDVCMPPTSVLQTRSHWQWERETEASRPGTGGSRLFRNICPRLLRSSHFYLKSESGVSAQGEVKMIRMAPPSGPGGKCRPGCWEWALLPKGRGNLYPFLQSHPTKLSCARGDKEGPGQTLRGPG